MRFSTVRRRWPKPLDPKSSYTQACAGRVKDLVESGKLSLSSVKYFILDEADRLLDTGNQDLILNLFARFPKAGTGAARLQVIMSRIFKCRECLANNCLQACKPIMSTEKHETKACATCLCSSALLYNGA